MNASVEVGHESRVGMRSDAVVLFVQEMFVDLFGIVIPGFCFIIVATFSLGFTLTDLLQDYGQIRHLANFQKFVENNTVISFLGIIVLSYVIGHLFFRQDPKWPDFASIRQLPEDDLKSGCVRTREAIDCAQYPYGYLRDYLTERGFTELTDYVNWTGADFETKEGEKESESRKKRSKHVINRLKLSIKDNGSHLFFDVIKNEAHIRLMSSMWYLSKASMALSLLSIFMLFLPSGIHYYKTQGLEFFHTESLIISVFILVCALILKRGIEYFFHYQRVREIVFVLHAWHLVMTRKPNSAQV